MTAFEICDIKQFMNKLLVSPLFDNFLLTEATIQTSVTYQIDGHLRHGFYSDEQLEALGIADYPYVPFSLVRNNCFNLMKGKNTPLSFHFVFQLSPENQTKTLAQTTSSFLPGDISGMFLNLSFKDNKLLCTTGIAYQIFSMDKTLDYEWDRLVERFFQKNQLLITHTL